LLGKIECDEIYFFYSCEIVVEWLAVGRTKIVGKGVLLWECGDCRLNVIVGSILLLVLFE
jgi:hypothetical protein